MRIKRRRLIKWFHRMCRNSGPEGERVLEMNAHVPIRSVIWHVGNHFIVDGLIRYKGRARLVSAPPKLLWRFP